MKYRVYYDDSENSEVSRVEVDARDLATALFLAGMQVAHNGHGSGPLEVLRAETAAWKDIELP